MNYIYNARIFLQNKPDYDVIERGFVAFKDGKIVCVGDMADYKNLKEKYEAEGENSERVFGLEGENLYPGFIDAHSHLGLFGNAESDSYADANEFSDPITPHIRAIDGINPQDGYFKEARLAGVTTVVTGAGSSNLFGGQLAAIKTGGSNIIDNLVIKSPVAFKLALGENPKRDGESSPNTRQGNAALIRETLFKAMEYTEKLENYNSYPENFDKPDFDFKLESLIPLFKGDENNEQIPAHFHAHRTDDIATAIRLSKEFNLKYVIVHATGAADIADELSSLNVNCIIGPLIVERPKPEMSKSEIDLGGILSKNGVKFAVCTDHPVVPINFLNLSAALAVKGGTSMKTAISSITDVAAEILGLSNRVGSIKKGLDADFVIIKGNFTDAANEVVATFIDGKMMM